MADTDKQEGSDTQIIPVRWWQLSSQSTQILQNSNPIDGSQRTEAAFGCLPQNNQAMPPQATLIRSSSSPDLRPAIGNGQGQTEFVTRGHEQRQPPFATIPLNDRI